ncbi:MAG: rhodanese-like domain-containing protein [Vicinamibacteria bacterium]
MTVLRRALLVTAASLGSLAALVSIASPGGRGTAESGSKLNAREITSIQLADWIKDRKPGLRILDVRSAADFDVFHLPGSLSAPLGGPPSIELGKRDVVVVYSEEDLDLGEALASLRSPAVAEAFALRRGLNGWLDEVMNPVLLAGSNTEDKAAFEKAAELSRYFGGVPRVLDATESAAFTRKKPSSSETRRRGC